jgi:pimeloyl-ACP methyl ester carboxylesterase
VAVPPIVRGDGVELHWEQRGSGPVVVVPCHWSGVPSVFSPLVADLARDHRVFTYDARGTGRSTRTGPHDIATGVADLVAVLEQAGEPAVLVALAEACNRSVGAAQIRPELVTVVVAQGTIPVPRQAFKGTDSMISSDGVVEAFLQMLASDYNTAQRTMMTTANPQMSEAEVRRRVEDQVAYCPADTAVARLRAWIEDDPREPARSLGDRLWILHSEGMIGPWFPPFQQVRKLVDEHLPRARLKEVEDGLVSRPDITAAVVRQITADALALAAVERMPGRS